MKITITNGKELTDEILNIIDNSEGRQAYQVVKMGDHEKHIAIRDRDESGFREFFISINPSLELTKLMKSEFEMVDFGLYIKGQCTYAVYGRVRYDIDGTECELMLEYRD